MKSAVKNVKDFANNHSVLVFLFPFVLLFLLFIIIPIGAAVVFTAVPSSGIMISEYFIPDSSRVADVIVIVAEVEFVTLIPNAESGCEKVS